MDPNGAGLEAQLQQLISRVPLSKLLKLSTPSFPYLQNKNIHLVEFWLGGEIVYVDL